MALGIHQKLKMMVSDFFFLLSLVMLLNSDRLATYVEKALYREPGDNKFSNFLDTHSFLRNGWNILLAEIWAMFVSFMWWQGFWTDSHRTTAFTKRTYFFLLVSMYIVPIFNIDSLLFILVEYIKGEEVNLQWNCIFLSDNGAYFINSMVLMALFGCAFTLTRWKSLLYQGYIYLNASSWSEIRARCQNAACQDFEFDANSADFLVNFTITWCLFHRLVLMANEMKSKKFLQDASKYLVENDLAF